MKEYKNGEELLDYIISKGEFVDNKKDSLIDENNNAYYIDVKEDFDINSIKQLDIFDKIKDIKVEDYFDEDYENKIINVEFSDSSILKVKY